MYICVPVGAGLLMQPDQDRQVAGVHDGDLIQIDDRVWCSAELLANALSQRRRSQPVHGAAHPHNHHLGDRCVYPQLQIEKHLLTLRR